MAARAVFLARLLAGEMPDEIEEAFDAAKVRLFPARRGDLVTSCSCPDTANPCKHIAAVYYLLAESFDENPFLIFEWRGRPRARLIAELRALRPSHREPTRQSAVADRDRGRGGRAGPPVHRRILGGREMVRGADRVATDQPSRRAPTRGRRGSRGRTRR